MYGHRVAGTAVAVILVGVVTAVPARGVTSSQRADQFAWTDGQGVGASATFVEMSNESSNRTAKRSSGPQCRYTLLPDELTDLADTLSDVGYIEQKGDGEGVWYRQECLQENGLETLTPVWRDPPRPRAATDPVDLAEQALQYAPIPLPGIGMNPPPDREQLVGVPVLLWMEPDSWVPVSTSASAGGVTVRVEAVPEHVTWDMGNGDQVVCGPGAPYDPADPVASESDCSYAYRRSSQSQPDGHYVVTATARWRARWTSTSGAGGDLGVVIRTTQIPVRVNEAQALNTVPIT